jgi:hypothetical protein
MRFHQSQSRFSGRSNDADKIIPNVPDCAVGAIIGKGGIRIKSFQDVDGIRRVNYDNVTKAVLIWGTPTATDRVAAQIQQIISLSINSQGFIPEKGSFCVNIPSVGVTVCPSGDAVYDLPVHIPSELKD